MLLACDDSSSSVAESSPPPVVPPTPPISLDADISLEMEEYDFGEIWDFEPTTITFEFTNTGSKILVINRLQAGCGCTTPKAKKTVLKPQETSTIEVTFDPKGKSNKQDKKVTIFSNAANSPEKAFWIRSYVKPFVKVKEKYLKLNEMTLGESHSVEFEFEPVDPNFEITRMYGTGKHGQFISGEELDVPEGTPKRIRINVSPNMPWGAFHSVLNIEGKGKTPDGESVQHAFTVLANGKTFGKVKANNHIVSLGTLSKGGSFHKRVHLYRQDGLPFKVLNTAIMNTSLSGINATAVQNIDGSHEIILSGTLPSNFTGPIPRYTELMVQTDVEGEEVLTFRIAGVVPKDKQ